MRDHIKLQDTEIATLKKKLAQAKIAPELQNMNNQMLKENDELKQEIATMKLNAKEKRKQDRDNKKEAEEYVDEINAKAEENKEALVQFKMELAGIKTQKDFNNLINQWSNTEDFIKMISVGVRAPLYGHVTLVHQMLITVPNKADKNVIYLW